MHRFRTCLLALIVAAALADLALAQDWRGRGMVRGQVADGEGTPLGGVELQARLEADGETLVTITTNDHGRFTLSGVQPGPWVLRVEHPGYEPLQQGVEASAVRSQEPVAVVLTKLPERALAAVDVDAANQAFLAGDWEAARAAYELALAKLPPADQAPVLLGIARTHLNEQNSEAAQGILEQVLELDPANGEAAQLLASALSAQGEIEAAQELLARFESVEPDFNTLVGIGVSKYNTGDIDTAREHFDRAISAQPDQPYPYYYRGLCFLSTEDNAAALADFERFLELNPDAEERAEVESYLDYLSE